MSANVDTPMEHSGCPRWYTNIFSSQLTSNSRYPAYNKLVANWVRNGKSNWSMDEVDSDRKPKQYSKTSSRTWRHLCVAVPAFVYCILEEIPSGLICHVFWWQNLADGWLTVLSNWLKVWSLKSKHKALIVSFPICLLRRSLWNPWCWFSICYHLAHNFSWQLLNRHSVTINWPIFFCDLNWYVYACPLNLTRSKPRQAASTGAKPLKMIEVANELTPQLNGLSNPVLKLIKISGWTFLTEMAYHIIFSYNLVEIVPPDRSQWNCRHQVKQMKIKFFLAQLSRELQRWRWVDTKNLMMVEVVPH